MDYIEGDGLDEILEEKGELSEAETLKLLGPVAAALDYAHSQGVVHRDVKPGNVMVRKDGTPFVLDFGIAREIQETMTRVTGKFSSGTLLYMSPEQLHGRGPKAAQDVYSFAAMAYECLKGEPPFARGQIEYQIDHDAPEPLEEGVASKALREGILAGLAKEPDGRPGSCAGVLGAAGGGASRPGEPGTGAMGGMVDGGAGAAGRTAGGAAGRAAGGAAGRAAGRAARPEGSPLQEERPTVRPLPNADAATAGGRDENVFLRKVRVGRALEEERRNDAMVEEGTSTWGSDSQTTKGGTRFPVRRAELRKICPDVAGIRNENRNVKLLKWGILFAIGLCVWWGFIACQELLMAHRLADEEDSTAPVESSSFSLIEPPEPYLD